MLGRFPQASLLLDAQDTVIVVFDESARCVAIYGAYSAAEAVSGRSAESSVGRTPEEFYPPPASAKFRAAIDRVLASNEVERLNHMEINDETLAYQAELAPLETADGRFVVVTLSDISEYQSLERKLLSERIVATRQLEESERRYRILADNAFSLVFEIAEDGRTTFVSPKLAELLGQPEEELVGPIAPNIVHPEDLPLARRIFRRILEGGSVEPYVVRLSNGDGGWWYAELVGSELTLDGDEHHILFFGRDVTLDLEDQEARRELEGRAILADRAQSVALLASGVAHDFNDLLSISMGVADLIRNEFPEDSPYRQHVEEIIQATGSAAALSRQLLAFAGGTDLSQFETLDLVATTTDLAPLIRATLPTGVQLRLELPPDPIWVDADRAQLGQILLNLVRNAGEASEAPAEVTISARLIAEESVAEERVLLEVVDQGHGVDPDRLERIFEPYFTTRERGHGLGLSVVREIVSRHGGSIEVESKPGAGTRFRIELPLAEAAAPDVVGIEEATEAKSQGLVLIVDDMPAFRKIASQLLAVAGFQSLEADRGERALEALRDEPAVVCALLDVALPGMDGVELARRIQALRPDLPIVWMTGAPDRVPEGASSYIANPFRQEALIAMVRRAIEVGPTTGNQGAT